MANQQNNIHEQEIIIRPISKLQSINFREIYKYRHMMWSMIRKDIRANFDDLYLGFFWAFARPLMMVMVFTLLKRFSGANMYVSIPYAVYVYSGLILWYYFLEAVNSTSRSIGKNAGLMKKVYFPRMITPVVPVVSSLYNFGLAIIPLAIMMLWHGIAPGWRLVLLPAVLLQCGILVIGIGTVFASLSLVSRDADRFLSLVLYIGLFVSPVIFAPDMIPKKAQIIYFLNPMAGTLLAFRSCMFADFPFPLEEWVYSLIFSFVILIIGTIIYRKTEFMFVDKL